MSEPATAPAVPLPDLLRTARSLADLLQHAPPCLEHGCARPTCADRLKARHAGNWPPRRLSESDDDALCTACRAYWHVSIAALHLEALAERQKRIDCVNEGRSAPRPPDAPVVDARD